MEKIEGQRRFAMESKKETGKRRVRSNKKAEEKVDLGRRKFLKSSAVVGASLVGATTSLGMLEKMADSKKGKPASKEKGRADNEEADPTSPQSLASDVTSKGDESSLEDSSKEEQDVIEVDEEPEEAIDNTEELSAEIEKAIQERELGPAGEIIVAQIMKYGKVTIDQKTKSAIYRRHYADYARKGKRHSDLINALKRMQPWIKAIKKEIAKRGIPERSIYVSVVESEFLLRESEKGAAGPFQFIKETATNNEVVDLPIVEGEIDTRLDPVVSGGQMAEYLKHLYEEYNKSIELTFGSYNGGYPERYKKSKKGKGMSYKDFLKFRENQINKYLERKLAYKVRRGDTLHSLANKWRVNYQQIKKINGLKDNNIRIGQKLNKPLSKKTIKRIINKDLRYSLQNLNYPEKIFAVMDVVEDLKLEKKYPAKPIQFESVKIEKDKPKIFKEKVRRGDSLQKVAKRIIRRANAIPSCRLTLAKTLKLIRGQNKKVGASNIIHPEQEIKIQIPSNAPTLKELAKKNGISPEDLKKANPAVKKVDKPLLMIDEIRIPKKGALLAMNK